MGGGTRNGATRFGRWLAAFALSAISGTAFGVDSDDSRILYFERLQLAAPLAQGQHKTAVKHALKFDAYGRRFELTLEPNDKLYPALQTQSHLALYRGQLDGIAGSWARISVTDGQLQGMVYDGTELYVIEPVAQLQDALPANTDVDADSTAIFRLADVAMTPGAASCGSETSAAATSTKGSDAFNSMVGELKGSPALMQAVGATKRLEIAALGDLLFQNRFGSEASAREEILRRLNNVDGIYSSQLGIEISVSSIDLGDSLSATTSASSLLNELGDLRKRSSNLYSRGLTHLFTGRNLDGSTVGIAFMNSVCDRQYGAGITEASMRSAWTESLIAAHEIGHNFGAPHDGDADEACASTATGSFLMSPSINGNDRFSACSLGIMQPKAASSSCITALADADIEVDAALGTVHHPADTEFDWEVTVRNVGGLTTSNARATLTVPATLVIDDASVRGGTCTSGAGTVSCLLGQIAGGNATTVILSLHSTVAAAHSISVDVSASNETNLANNHGEGTISTQPEVDLAVSLQAPVSITAGTAFSATLSASNLSENDADSVTLTIALPAGVTASSATFDGNSCTVGTSNVTCSLPALASGESVTGSITLTASTAGSAVLQAQISSGQVDKVTNNDTAAATVSVTSVSATATQSGSSGGGGGGSTSPGLLALLFGALALKNRQRRY
ncbi:M12 family metallo-peptidase [Steroidobacter sp.]|uniref:M12 family metallo-peptidase n=1 Tax=Steroidobacter sp. TaxID=1978227 RepID=UPI001A3C67D3|nr:M12 family metallo-peptidase [Steroidobacter sp.]MBL8271675.1 hypothetical protein [Steroidobacter sp.]